MTSIPSEEEFARAKRLMEEDSRGLDEICSELTKLYRKEKWFYRVYILPQTDVNFRVYMFFKHNSDVDSCKVNGVTKAIEDAVYEKLERYGRGKRVEITVAFEWDSNENVRNNFEGNYFLRLR